MKKSDVVIFGLSGSKKLAEEIAKKANIELGDSNLKRFKDGEIFFNTKTSVRGKVVFVVQSTSSPVNENIMELLIFLDMLRRISVKEVNVIIPYFGYARQDRKSNGREPITSALVAELIQKVGADRIISFDFHSPQIQGFFSIPVDELKSIGIICNEIKKLKLKDIIVVSPDHGGVKRARSLAKLLDVPIAIIDKRRNMFGDVEQMHLLGEVENKNCIIIDDMVDSGGTILKAVELILKKGAKSINVATTHAVLSGSNENEVLDKLFNIGVEKFITTNSIEKKYDEKFKNKVIITDLSESLAGVIDAHINRKSITDFFIKKYNIKL